MMKLGVFDYVLGGILLVAAVFIIIAVLMQQGKSKGMGAVGGGTADTFFGKTKGKSFEKTLAKLTTVIGIIFVVIVLVIYIKQPDVSNQADDYFDQNKDVTTTVKETEENKPENTTDSTTSSDTTDSTTDSGTTAA
ncbi:MAG: preprotein translocase subunit SecG [Ruminococcaceae bacterium]|nr:preprotein translocase subunit SecG [Oscillospiraceae bacterium]